MIRARRGRAERVKNWIANDTGSRERKRKRERDRQTDRQRDREEAEEDET